MELFLIRHTSPAVAKGVCYGRLDVPLADSAVSEISATLALLPRMDSVFSSPSQRCARLAEAIAKRDDCHVAYTTALQELDFGAWEGRPWPEISRHESDPWATDPWHRAPPGGETEQALWERVLQWCNEVLTNLTGHHAIVAHGGPLRALRSHLLRLDTADRWSWNIAWGEVVRIEI